MYRVVLFRNKGRHNYNANSNKIILWGWNITSFLKLNTAKIVQFLRHPPSQSNQQIAIPPLPDPPYFIGACTCFLSWMYLVWKKVFSYMYLFPSERYAYKCTCISRRAFVL